MKKYSTHDTKPSEMFWNCLQGGGSREIECGCGRHHYAVWDEDDEEIDDASSYHQFLIDQAEEHKKDNPEGVIIDYESSFIYYKDLNGQVWAQDCPCNRLAVYEKHYWSDKDAIRRYLKVRIDDEYRLAQEQLTLNVLAGIE